MKSLLLSAATAFALASVPAFAADPLEGNWRTTKDDNGNSGLITVAPCGDKLCGVLVKAFDANGAEVSSANVGRKLIWDTVNAGGGEYRGKVYSPDRDKTYKSKLILKGNKLTVSGCVFGICREGGVWTRN